MDRIFHALKASVPEGKKESSARSVFEARMFALLRASAHLLTIQMVNENPWEGESD